MFCSTCERGVSGPEINNHKELGHKLLTDEEVWQNWVNEQKKLIDDAKADPANIRYYLGKYKVCIIPSQKDGLYKGYRTVAALEEFPHNGICMMIGEGEQFSSSTRHLYLKPLNSSNPITNQEPKP